jgi:nitrite reductase/ring-hydroxylating ferredoxin subunit
MSEDRTPLTAELVEALDGLIQRLSDHPDPQVGADVRALLAGLDTVHRAGLTRLASEIQAMAGEAFLSRLCQDPEIELLLMCYGLVAVNRTIQADEALDAVRSHLGAHGVAVEVQEVVGGVVYVRLDYRPSADVDEAAVRNDLETALRARFLGFQELQIGERPWSAPTGALVQLERRRPPGAESFQTVAEVRELKGAGPVAITPLGQEGSVLLLENGDAIGAFRNRCGSSPLPLHFSQVEDGVLVCSWHGCRYDPVSGKRVDRPEEPGLIPVPVRILDGQVQVAVEGRGP